MVRGKGSTLWDSDGREYLDLFAGFGAAILGHCHPALIAAVTDEVPDGGCVNPSVIGPTLPAVAKLVGIPLKLMTPVAGT